jgi:Uma2 family endonuclease
MASSARVANMITLEEFLRLPAIDERPYLEYIDGRIEVKVSPQKKQGLLEQRLILRRPESLPPSTPGESSR